jgi:uncharacterized protein (TIGR02453 family)
MPEPAKLAAVRQEIDYNSARFLKLLNDKKFKKHFKGLDDFDKLKTVPKGYAKDHPQIEYLKHKSFIVETALSDADVINKNFPKKVAELARIVKPFNDFLKESMA